MVASLLSSGHMDEQAWRLLAISLPDPSEGAEGMTGARRGQLLAIRDVMRDHMQSGKPTPRVPEELKALVATAMTTWRERTAVFRVVTGDFSVGALTALGVTLPQSLVRRLDDQRDAPHDDLRARLAALRNDTEYRAPPSHTPSELFRWLRQTVQSDRSVLSVTRLQARVAAEWGKRQTEENERRRRAEERESEARARSATSQRATQLWEEVLGRLQPRRDKADESRLRAFR